jgi:hypothetical protein
MRRTRSPCCECAASGHAAAAPPSSVMNARRFIRSPRRPPFAERELWNIGSKTAASVCLDVEGPDHLAPLSVSSAISLPKSAGDAAWMRNPRSSYFALISGRARDALISLLSNSTISAWIFLGPGGFDGKARSDKSRRESTLQHSADS